MKIDLLGFGPHPDDVEITSAGLFLKMRKMGYKTAIVDLTRGERGTRGTPEIRASEAGRAAKLLGLSARVNLGLPDGELLLTRDAKRAVAAVVREFRPSLVVAPYEKDSHPDHAHASRIVTEGCFIAGLAKLDLPGEPHRPKAILHTLYHQEKDFWPDFVVDVTAEWEGKKKVMACYASQFHKPGSRARATNISRRDFLPRIEARARVMGDHVGVEFGEGYITREPLLLSDPVGHFEGWKKL